MFSYLATSIFGSTDEPSENGASTIGGDQRVSPNDQEEDWVVVGGDVQPALTLGSLDEVVPRPSTGSTGSSEAPSETGAEEEEDDMIVVEGHGDDPSSREITLTRSARRLTSPLSCPNGVSLPQMKALRASQKSKQKDASKHLTSKATERRNKAVKIRSNHSGKKNKMTNLSIKSSGFNKNLKQC
jgi:hypothetical protein